jgi:two-component system chemotaxis response regulator CheB
VHIRRVLICDDSASYAAGLAHLLEFDSEIDVVGVCDNAEQALATLAQLKPDLVTMDLELPGMSGLSAIEQIMSNAPVPILVLSGHVEHRSRTALEALAAGALDAMPKDDLNLREPDSPAAQALRHRVKVLSRARVIHHPRAHLSTNGSSPATWARTASAIGVCASAGGPPALRTVLAALPATFPVPILVVQHIAAGFVDGLVSWLDSQVPLPVRLASAGPKAKPGIWVAPDGSHLTLAADGRFVLRERASADRHCPSADVMLSSLAASAGASAVAIVLTGMGRDGADGLADVQRAGGLTIAQDEETSAVYGMPLAAAQRGAELVLPLDKIGARVRALEPVAALR